MDSGKYSYTYVTLEKLTNILFPLLTKVGLAYTAAPDMDSEGRFGLRARLVHESGEEIGGFYPLGSATAPAQAIGSAITYARRYALLSLTGVAPGGEDDDGARASEASAKESSAPTKEEKPKSGLDAIKEEMSALIEGSKGKITGEDANATMSAIAPNKTVAEWTLTDMKKGRDALVALLAERSK